MKAREVMGRGGAATQYDAIAEPCSPFGQPLGYPVLGCPVIGCVDPMHAAAAVPALVDPWACFGAPFSPLVVQQVEQPARFLRPRCPQGIRAEPIGLGCACIDPGEEVTLECCFSDITKVKALIIPASVAFQLLMMDITIGRECFLQCGPMPASMFTEDAEVGDFDFPTANDGECISVTVKNISRSQVEVRMAAHVLTVYY